MIKYGEIISLGSNTAAVRIYKLKHDTLEPSALTLSAKMTGSYSIGDIVAVEVNMLLFHASTAAGYLLPFIVSLIALLITGVFTDNIIISQIVFLICLALCYIFAVRITDTEFFRRFTVCTVKEIIKD